MLSQDYTEPLELRRLTLPDIVDDGLWCRTSLVPVLSIDVGALSVDPHLDGKELKLEVKYGERWSTVQCDSHGLRPRRIPAPVAAEFSSKAAAAHQRQPALAYVNTTFFFKGCRHGDPRIKFRLVETTSGKAKIIAKGVVADLLSEAKAETLEVRLFTPCWLKRNQECIGSLIATIERHSIPRILLQCALQVMNAERQPGGFTARHSPLVEGVLVVGNQGSSTRDIGIVLKGQALETPSRWVPKHGA